MTMCCDMAGNMTGDTPWSAFLARSDMRWQDLPKHWDSGPFVGNGHLGAIMWQNAAGAFHMEVSRNDLYDHRRRDGWPVPPSVLHTTCRLPNGHFEIGWPGVTLTGTMRLDLWNAELRGQLAVDSEVWQMRCYTHADRDVIVLELKGRGRRPEVAWHPDISASTRTFRNPPGLEVPPYPPQTLKHVGDVTVSVQDMPVDARYHTDGLPPSQYATAWAKADTGDGVAYYMSTQYSCSDLCAAERAVQLVRQAKQEGIASLTHSHRHWWHTFYPKSLISVPDTDVESFYWIQMYKMGSASRRGGPILDLMGPWYMETQWPAIWWNLNIQLTYWPFYMSNHLPEAEPLPEALWRHRDALAANAAPHSGDACAIGRATGPDCRGDVGTEVGNLPWALHNLWLHYRSSMDDAFLREPLFPLMKGAFRNLWHRLNEQPDGTLTLPKTASPEYADAVESCSYTLACLRWLASALIAADERLKADDPICADCQTVLDRLEPYPVDEATGFMVGRDMPFAESHRHWSHLFMIYPFHEYTWDQPGHVSLIETSLKNWTEKSEAFAGYSWLGAASMYAAAGQGDQALGCLKTFLHRCPLPNTLYREGNPVIETPLAFARTLQEMLMTSHGDVIRIFPGIPSSWKEAVFDNLRAEGAFLVSARRQDGATQYVRVTSLAGERCRIRTGLSGEIRTHGDLTINHDPLTGVTECRPARGQTVLFTSDDAPVSPDFRPLDIDVMDAGRHWGGRTM